MEKKRLLIVDDTIANLQLLGNLLQQKYSLSFATSGQEALELLGKSIPDLILLDIMMPKIDGYEVCRQVRTNPLTKYVPIIFLTAKSDRDSVVKGMAAGAQDYLIKPFAAEDVLARIESQLPALIRPVPGEEGRPLEKTEKIFLENRLANASACQELYKTELTAEIGEIENRLNPLVSVIPPLLDYIKDVEDLLYSQEMDKKNILAALETIQETRLNPEVTSSVHTLHDSLQDIQFSLLDFLSDHSPALRQTDAEARFSLSHLINELRPLITGHVAIEWRLQEDPQIEGDEAVLQQVLLSLIDNALDASHTAGKDTDCVLEVEKKQSRLSITLRDPGPGIPDELAGTVFEAGFSTKFGRGGHGLTASRYLLDQHFQGELTVHPGASGRIEMLF